MGKNFLHFVFRGEILWTQWANDLISKSDFLRQKTKKNFGTFWIKKYLWLSREELRWKCSCRLNMNVVGKIKALSNSELRLWTLTIRNRPISPNNFIPGKHWAYTPHLPENFELNTAPLAVIFPILFYLLTPAQKKLLKIWISCQLETLHIFFARLNFIIQSSIAGKRFSFTPSEKKIKGELKKFWKTTFLRYYDPGARTGKLATGNNNGMFNWFGLRKRTVCSGYLCGYISLITMNLLKNGTLCTFWYVSH